MNKDNALPEHLIRQRDGETFLYSPNSHRLLSARIIKHRVLETTYGIPDRRSIFTDPADRPWHVVTAGYLAAGLLWLDGWCQRLRI